MKRRVLAVVALLGSACNVLFSLDGYAGDQTLASCSSCKAERCQCAPKAPADFDYVRLHFPSSAGDGCPSGTTAALALGQGARDTGCACSCKSPAPGGACGLAIFAGKGCSGMPSQMLTGAACTAISVTGEASAATLLAAGTPCEVTADLVAPEFATPILACIDATPGSDCDSKSICTAAPDAPFDAAACVLAKTDGDTSCPAAYGHKYKLSTGRDDQRSCGASGCGCDPQKCPSTLISLCDSADCSSCPKANQPINGCADFGGLSHALVNSAGTTQGGCQPQGSATSIGIVKPTGTRVVCCRDALASASADAGTD